MDQLIVWSANARGWSTTPLIMSVTKNIHSTGTMASKISKSWMILSVIKPERQQKNMQTAFWVVFCVLVTCFINHLCLWITLVYGHCVNSLYFACNSGPEFPPNSITVSSVVSSSSSRSSAASSAGILVTWEGRPHLRGSYRILLTPHVLSNEDRQWSEHVVSSQQNSNVIHNLQPNQTYFLIMSAENSYGTSSSSPVKAFRTAGGKTLEIPRLLSKIISRAWKTAVRTGVGGRLPKRVAVSSRQPWLPSHLR